MQEIIRLAIAEIRGMWRYRWLAITIAWVICSVGWLYVYTMPNIYEAHAQVYVDADSRLVEVMGEVGVAPGIGATVFVVQQAMLSRPQLENVAKDTGLDQRTETDEDYNNLILDLQETIAITPGRYADAKNLYTISYMDRDPEMAKSVVTALLDRFVTDVLERNDEGSEQATSYLDDQLTYYNNALSELERKLADFKKQNIGLLPGENGGVFERLTLEMNLLKQLRLDLSIETDRRAALRGQLRSENPNLPVSATAAGGADIIGSPTENTIRQLEATRASLLLGYTERHPDVVAIDEQLEQLYEKRKMEMAAYAAKGDGIEGAANATNPVYQSVQIALNNSSVSIASFRSEIIQHEAVVKQLKNQINTIPDVEARYAQLNRDYEQYGVLYNQLLVQKERDRMGEAGDKREVVSFNIIEPPATSIEPVAPRRTILLLLVLAMGLGAGAGIAYLIHIGHPVFNDLHALRTITGRPVLGAVSMTWVNEHRAKRVFGLASFSIATVFLMLTFVLSIAMQNSGVAVMQRLLAAGS